MNIIPVKLEEMEKLILELGFAGENMCTGFSFICDSVFSEYPNAVPSMAVTPPKGSKYPVVVTRDGNNVLWNVTDSDTAFMGNGEVQLIFTQNNVVKRSYTCRTRILKSIIAEGTPPDPVQSWIDAANEMLAEIPGTIDTAIDEAIAAAKASGDFKGDPGFSPVVTTSPISGGNSVTITDEQGDHTFNVLNGTNGVSPDLEVTEIQGGHRITITDVSGSNTFDVMNGENGVQIDDTTPSATKTYSSEKVDNELSLISTAIHGIDDDLADPVGFLEVNDFDSEIGGKVNTLKVPYEMTDFLNNSIILSNGNIRTEGASQDYGCMVSPLIEVVEGKTYGLKVHQRSTVGNIKYVTNYGYGLFGSDGTTTVLRSAQSDLGNDIYIFTIPNGAKYIRFVIDKGTRDDTNKQETLTNFNQWILLPDADETIDDSFFVLGEKKEDGEISEIYRRDGSKLVIVDEEARAKASEIDSIPITFGRRTCAIFEKVCCIGDSFTEGYIYNSSGVANTNPNYSWVKHLENMTGREYVNCGISGATTKSWLTNANGLAKAQLPANKAQAYIIGLQINDAATELTVGTVADIGTSADSYYGYTSKIIDEMFTINDDAHVFLLTQPKNYTGEHTPYRTAILNIVEWYQTEGNGTHQNQVHLLDLLDYYKLFLNPGCSDSSANGHYTAVGWEYTAEIIMYAWSNYLNEHPLLFQDVNLIPFGTT